MLAFILRRLAQSIVVMLVVALISFMLFRYVGDPIANLVGQESRISDIEELRQRLGLNDPFYVQFARFIANAVQGEFGISYRLQQPVTELIVSRLPATIELAFASAMIALVFGVVLGVFTALRPKTFATGVIMTLSLVGVSLPTFLIGIGLIYIFAVELLHGGQPVGRRVDVVRDLEIAQVRDANHVEFVEVGSEYREKLQPLEPRRSRHARLGENPSVELEPAELAVDEVLGKERVAHGSHGGHGRLEAAADTITSRARDRHRDPPVVSRRGAHFRALV